MVAVGNGTNRDGRSKAIDPAGRLVLDEWGAKRYRQVGLWRH
jgi:hypothetical protein